MEAKRFLKSINTSYLLYIRRVIAKENKENTIGFTLKNLFHNNLNTNHIIKENHIPTAVLSGNKPLNLAFFCKNTTKFKVGININLITDDFSNKQDEYIKKITTDSRQVKDENDDIKLISINIFPSTGSYFDKNEVLKDIGLIKPETLEFYKHYENKYYYDKIINYIVNVEKPPNNISSFNEATPYIQVKELINEFNFS